MLLPAGAIRTITIANRLPEQLPTLLVVETTLISFLGTMERLVVFELTSLLQLTDWSI